MSRKWNIYAVASMIFLIPTILSTILSLVANSIALYKTSASSTSLMLIVMCYAMGLLSDDMIIENQIDITSTCMLCAITYSTKFNFGRTGGNPNHHTK